jgi:hypothetical protein
MKIKFRLESWNPKTCRYQTSWEGQEKYAFTMINKPYNKRNTRRLIKITEEIIAVAKKEIYYEG